MRFVTETRTLTAYAEDDLEAAVLYAKAEAVMSTPELLSRPRILLVDDEIEQLKLRAHMIKMCGFPVVTAKGPMEAIDIMTDKPLVRIDLELAREKRIP